jgi:hypothetical protein
MTSQDLTTGLILQDWVKMLLLALQKKENGEFLVVLCESSLFRCELPTTVYGN